MIFLLFSVLLQEKLNDQQQQDRTKNTRHCENEIDCATRLRWQLVEIAAMLFRKMIQVARTCDTDGIAVETKLGTCRPEENVY